MEGNSYNTKELVVVQAPPLLPHVSGLILPHQTLNSSRSENNTEQ